MSAPADLGVPPPRGRYSTVALVPAGHGTALFSGLTGRRLDGSIASSAEEQTEATLAHLATALERVGADPASIAHLRTFLVGREAIDGFKRARQACFDTWYGDAAPPASTLAVVAGLSDPGATVEIEATVALAPGTPPWLDSGMVLL